MWNHLSFLGSSSNCKRLLNGEINPKRSVLYENGPELEKKANQIAMCINQGREYFYAAQKVSINTSPLLYFYGMLSLAKSLIVSNNRDLFLEDIEYHGLTARPNSEYLKKYKRDSSKWEIEKEFAVTKGGVFKHLSTILNDYAFEDDSIFRFKDVISICPELSAFFKKYYKEDSKLMDLYSISSKKDPTFKLELALQGLDENVAYTHFPELITDFVLDPEILHKQARKFSSKNLTEFPSYFRVQHGIVGGRYLVEGIKFFYASNTMKRCIHEATADYLAMFILSNCVRYKQDFWNEIIRGQKSGVLGLIEIYISIIKRRYPNFILESLFEERFIYGTPAHIEGKLLNFF